MKSQQTSAKFGRQFAKQIVVLSILKVELDNLVDLKTFFSQDPHAPEASHGHGQHGHHGHHGHGHHGGHGGHGGHGAAGVSGAGGSGSPTGRGNAADLPVSAAGLTRASTLLLLAEVDPPAKNRDIR